MRHRVFILRRAQREVADLPTESYERIRDRIRQLANNPRPSDCHKLTGRDGWRIRVGDYRVIYEINDKDQSVVVLHVGHRRDVYR
jgi:mRNA interferase RelE/StbE